jgi:hypothetical protein
MKVYEEGPVKFMNVVVQLVQRQYRMRKNVNAYHPIFDSLRRACFGNGTWVNAVTPRLMELYDPTSTSLRNPDPYVFLAGEEQDADSSDNKHETGRAVVYTAQLIEQARYAVARKKAVDDVNRGTALPTVVEPAAGGKMWGLAGGGSR